MPTYGYQCSACGKRYEKREGFDAPARQKCQFCGKPATRILYAPPIVFKGSGFYKTDSRSSNGSSKSKGKESRDKESRDKESAGSGTKSSEKRSDSTR